MNDKGETGNRGCVPNIATATGDFYSLYKRDLLRFLDDFVKGTGTEALKGGHLNEDDAKQLSTGLRMLAQSRRDLFGNAEDARDEYVLDNNTASKKKAEDHVSPADIWVRAATGCFVKKNISLIQSLIDEGNPTFSDEAMMQSLWQMLAATFLIAQHAGITDSAKAFVKDEVRKASTDPARAARRGGKATRLDIARPFILAAARDKNGNIKNRVALDAKINAALAKCKDDKGQLLHEPLGSRAITNYIAAINKESGLGINDIVAIKRRKE